MDECKRSDPNKAPRKTADSQIECRDARLFFFINNLKHFKGKKVKDCGTKSSPHSLLLLCFFVCSFRRNSFFPELPNDEATNSFAVAPTPISPVPFCIRPKSL